MKYFIYAFIISITINVAWADHYVTDLPIAEQRTCEIVDGEVVCPERESKPLNHDLNAGQGVGLDEALKTPVRPVSRSLTPMEELELRLEEVEDRLDRMQ